MLTNTHPTADIVSGHRALWSTQEWDKIASEMQRRNPGKHFKSYSDVTYTFEDFEDAMEAVIPQEQQRAFGGMVDIRSTLCDAFQRLYRNKGQPVQVNTSPVPKAPQLNKYIVWTPEQWEAVILEYNKLYPGEFSERLMHANMRKVNLAIEVLPFELRRNFFAPARFVEPALKFWDGLSDEARNKHLQDRAVLEFPNAIVVQPVPTVADNKSAMATAVQKAFTKLKEEPKKEPKPQKEVFVPKAPAKIRRDESKPRITWEDWEWKAIALEMIRQNPHAGYLHSELSAVEMEAIRAAMRVVIPAERRRKIHDRQRMRAGLLPAFAMLRADLEESIDKPIEPLAAATVVEEVKTEEAPQVVAEAPVEQVAEVKVEALPEVKVEPIPAPTINVESAIQAASAKIAHSLADAATPFLASILGNVFKAVIPEITKSLLPELTKTLSVELAKSIQIPAPQVIYAAAAPTPSVVASPLGNVSVTQAIAPNVKPVSVIQDETVAVYVPQELPKPRKPKIVLVGPRGKQKNEFEMAYPEFQFMFIENGHGIKEAGRTCELLVASMKHLPPSLRQSIKANVPNDKIRYADSPGSAMRREIETWKATQHA